MTRNFETAEFSNTGYSVDRVDIVGAPPRRWHIVFHAPTIKPVRKKKTGRMFTRNPMLNANDRDHHRVVSPIRKEWRRRGRGIGNGARIRDAGLQRVRVDAYIQRPINNDSDAGNFYPTVKPIIDGLIDARMLPDDNDRYLQGPFLHPGPKGPYAVILVITELSADAVVPARPDPVPCAACAGTGWQG